MLIIYRQREKELFNDLALAVAVGGQGCAEAKKIARWLCRLRDLIVELGAKPTLFGLEKEENELYSRWYDQAVA